MGISQGRSVLFACALLALAGMAQADPITIHNTGVNASGTPLANGTVGDPHYTLISVPSGTTTIQTKTSAGGFPVGPWLGDDSLSDWIGPDSDSSLDGPTGYYEYQTTFDLTGFDIASAVITGQWSTDDQGANILINGVSTGDTASGFTSWSSFTIDTGFVEGVNTLDFIVYNASGPTGLRVEMTGTADPAVPEPATLTLLGAGLAAFSAFRRRRASK